MILLRKLPRATTKTKDITGGLPRVAELFEVRKPKEIAVLSEIDGYVSIAKAHQKRKTESYRYAGGCGREKRISYSHAANISMFMKVIMSGPESRLIGGSANPQDILNIKGKLRLARYLVDEVQEVYRLAGCKDQ